MLGRPGESTEEVLKFQEILSTLFLTYQLHKSPPENSKRTEWSRPSSKPLDFILILLLFSLVLDNNKACVTH